ncbi:MAG: recombination regulator RecX [Bdellovibrionaceae bacterium]|nr:recombination regulator RecX [Pseudobdellovibrionaceae bacterium]
MFRDKENTTSAWNYALRLLSRRDHSPLELREKLLRKGHDQDEVDATIRRAQELKLIPHDAHSEYALARRWMQSWQAKGKGPLWIRAWLRARGLPDPTSGPTRNTPHNTFQENLFDDGVEGASLDTSEDSWLPTAMRELEKRFKHIKDHSYSSPGGKPQAPFQTSPLKQKAFRFLLSKGYPSSIAQEAIKRWLSSHGPHQGPVD